MKVMVNIAKYVNLAENEMKQLGAPQFVMYTKEPGASREVNITVPWLSSFVLFVLIIPGLVVFVLIVLVFNLVTRCDSGPSCGGAAEESCQ